jgi:hypothetical protein
MRLNRYPIRNWELGICFFVISYLLLVISYLEFGIRYWEVIYCTGKMILDIKKFVRAIILFPLNLLSFEILDDFIPARS